MRLPSLRSRPLAKASSSLWKRGNRPGSTTAVMFVHGLGTDADKTWGDLLELCLEDEELLNFSFHKFEYKTSKIEWKPWVRVPSLDELAYGLATEIKLTVGDANIIVIAHSMGGLIVRKLTIDQIIDSRTLSVRRALLLATPNSGAALAALAAAVFPRHAQTRLLAPFSSEIEGLNDD
jgi:triacylglycerol esterase/lipase EstA (alpha/beta hydrolase family)